MLATPAVAEEPPLPDLPPAAWLDIIRLLRLRERFLAATVCTEWRDLAIDALTPELHVVLLNDAAAVGFGRWLRRYGSRLRKLTMQEYACRAANRQIEGALTPLLAQVRFDASVGSAQDMTRLSYAARLALWHGLAAGPVEQLESLTLLMDEVDAADAVAIGMINMPRLTALDFASNASIGFRGAAGLTPLTTLRTLMLPTQAIGDEGLKTIGASLTGLRELSLHNDGHVSDDGLVHLQGLAELTCLDLQGNVSITGAALSNIAAGLPNLVVLNLAHCSLVDDAGLGHLSDLQSLHSLNLHRTGVQCESRSAVAALRRLTALTHLDLSESHISGAGIANLATSRALLKLNLQAADSLDSSDDLVPLRQLGTLRCLDISECKAVCLHALPALTQLTRLVADFMLPPAGADSPGASSDIVRAKLQAALTQLAVQYQATFDAAAADGGAAEASAEPAAASTSAEQGGAADEVGHAAAAAAAGTGMDPDAWVRLLLQLPQQLTQLDTLSFASNLHSEESASGKLSEVGRLEAAVLLLGFGCSAASASGEQSRQLRELDVGALPPIRLRGSMRDRSLTTLPTAGLVDIAALLVEAVPSLAEAVGDRRAGGSRCALIRRAITAAYCVLHKLLPGLERIRLIHPHAARMVPSGAWLDVAAAVEAEKRAGAWGHACC